MSLQIKEHTGIDRDAQISQAPIPEEASGSDDDDGPFQDVPLTPAPTTTTTTTTTTAPRMRPAKRPRPEEAPGTAPAEGGEPEPQKESKTAEDSTPNDVDERTRVLKKLERLIIKGALKKDDLESLKDCKEIIKFLKDLHNLDETELKVMEALLRQKILRDNPLGDPITLLQRALARAGGIVRGSARIEERIEKDAALTMGLDELCGDYIDSVPAVLKVCTALFTDLVELPEFPGPTSSSDTPSKPSVAIPANKPVAEELAVLPVATVVTPLPPNGRVASVAQPAGNVVPNPPPPTKQ